MLGLELFSNKARFNKDGEIDLEHGHSPTFNFDGFKYAFSTLFILLTNDPSSAIYYNYYRTVGSLSSTLYWVSFNILSENPPQCLHCHPPPELLRGRGQVRSHCRFCLNRVWRIAVAISKSHNFVLGKVN
jgi:hypothetical protein